jgi:hypothetical protein
MIRRPLLVACLVALAPGAARAQTAADSAAIHRAALDYVEGFYEGDSTKHVRSIRPEVYKYGFWLPRDSTRYLGEQMTWPQFHAYTARFRARGAKTPENAPREIRLLDVLDQTAAVKLTAWWGVDYLLLGKYDGRWMISHVLWQSPPRSGLPPER